MQPNGRSSTVRNWHEMDRTLKLSAVLGLVSGVWVSFVLAFYLPVLLPQTGGSPPPLSAYYPGLFFYIVSPLAAFISAVALLVQPMTRERRGVVGFIAFVASLPGIPLSLAYISVLLSGT